MREFFIPGEEKLACLGMAITTLQQVLHACMEYRNLAIEKGATKEDLELALCDFDKEEFGNQVDRTLRNLNYLFLNAISESSDQPKESPKKAELPKVTKGIDANFDYLLTPQKYVPLSVRKDFFHRFIEGFDPFPTDLAKERIADMDYADFLKTPYWKSIALYIKERDGKKCTICGATKTLEVHHLSYDNHGDELNHLDDLTCICRKCHENQHSK